ncbi:hypothetical protein BDV33DRAFT_101678 [Aspergillus novoparasiticus]|uniref:Helicase/UvrB N-terminal domain-containing protein n=1 Tax=Aspergillus novoparasiticus TaxID=986946 RepID=A0A5N6E7X0_9EURO|nr:hypothetical protein BDV33DRAFT_101678 [Aspergillus novoparasiticus]
MDGFRPRSYQQDMLEMSLRENIIVVMDTGSGKTHIYASLRLNAISSGGNNQENKESMHENNGRAAALCLR